MNFSEQRKISIQPFIALSNERRRKVVRNYTCGLNEADLKIEFADKDEDENI